MAAVVAGGAVAALAALAATVVVPTRGDHPEPAVDTNAAVAAEPIEE